MSSWVDRTQPRVPRVHQLCICLLLLLAACTDSRHAAQKQLREIGTPRLRHDAAILYKQLFSSPSADYLTLKPSQWPASFALLRPMQVGASRDGFTLTLVGKNSTQSGLHIAPDGMSTTPKASHAKYQKIEDGIYWYSIVE